MKRRGQTMRTRRWWKVWVLGLALLMAGAATASADERAEHDLPDMDEGEFEDDERPTLDDAEAPPRRQVDDFVEQREFEGQRLQDEAIVRLQDLIESTPVDDPARAEYLYNLSEMYWQLSRYYASAALNQQDECYQLEDEGADDEARRCWFRMEDMEAESERRRDESIELYVEIIRNYPNFEELDTIYFQLGSNMMDMDEERDGLEILRRLLSEFPQTEYQPQALLLIGDYYFDEGEMFEALDAYQRVVQFPESPVYQYARYKMGWAYFNLSNYEQALEQYLKVVDLARQAEEGTPDRAMLSQVQTDIVRVYARIGSPDRAVPFFQDLAPEREDWLELTERLAIFYGNEGAYADSSHVYNQLISINEESYKVVDYQYEIVRNETTIDSYSEDSLRQIIRLFRLVQLADEGRFTEDEELYHEEIFPRVHGRARYWATTYHREAQRTRNQSLFVMAHHLYDGYYDTFPESEELYEMSFFHGELLYDIEEWNEAARAYERVVEIDPDGEYTGDAVLATMLALLNVVEPSEERADLETEFDFDDEDGPQVPEPEEFSEDQERLVRAAHNYIEYVPEGDQIEDVKYTLARTYYDHQHYQEAADVFADLAFSHPDHRLAEVSANLHLDSLNMIQDFDALNDAVTAYLEEEPITDSEFQNDLREMSMVIRYNMCVVLDEEEKWEEAANCYVEYVQDFPDADQAAMALYNAALDFERINEIGLAIQVRRNLLQMDPDPELAAETLYNLGGNFHAWAIYGEASRYYELYVHNFPDEEHAEDALSNAATFRHGLGEYEEAVRNYERYLELFGEDNPEHAAQVFYEIGEIYESQGRDQDAYDQYRAYIRDYADQGVPDLLLQSHVNLGIHYWDRDRQGDRDEALSIFEETVQIYEGLDEEQREVLVEGRDAAAQAKFMIGEDVFEQAEAIRIDSTDAEELQEVTEEKLAKAEEARAIYEEVIVFGRPDWAIASLYQIGRGFEDFAETLRDSPVPDGLTVGQEEQYRGLLEDQAMIFEDQAVELYEQALHTARDANWFNEYSEQAETQLASLRPEDYRRPSEMRAQPTYIKDRFMRSAFATSVDDEELLEELSDDEDLASEDEVPDEVTEDGGQAQEEGDEEEGEGRS